MRCLLLNTADRLSEVQNKESNDAFQEGTMPRIPESFKRKQLTKEVGDWTVEQIDISKRDGNTKQITVLCRNPFAIHKSIDSDKWCLTHVPTGKRILSLTRESNILEAGQIFTERWTREFSLKSADQLKTAIPPWIINWIKSCTLADEVLPIKEPS